MLNRLSSGEPFLIREVTNVIREEQYYGLKLFGGMLIWQRKEDVLEDAETGGWYIIEEVISIARVKVWKDLAFLMKFLHVGWEMTRCGRLLSALPHHTRIPPSW